MTVLLQQISTLSENTYCNGTLTVNNVLTPNSTFTQSILNLIHHSASAAVKKALNLNRTFTQSILNLLYNSATSAYIYIDGYTYCNGTLTENNTRTPNSTYTQSILNLIYDSVTAAYICICGKIYCNRTFAMKNSTNSEQHLHLMDFQFVIR